jgi:homoserine O-acetyltransferase
MLAHLTYVSERSLEEKFGRHYRGDRSEPGFGIDFEVESYLDHRATSFLERFDANSYLYLSRVMDYFDPFADAAAVRAQLQHARTRTLVLSFDTDWRFPTRHSVEIAEMLESAGAPVARREIASPHGHDSFLLPVPEYHQAVRAFLDS